MKKAIFLMLLNGCIFTLERARTIPPGSYAAYSEISCAGWYTILKEMEGYPYYTYCFGAKLLGIKYGFSEKRELTMEDMGNGWQVGVQQELFSSPSFCLSLKPSCGYFGFPEPEGKRKMVGLSIIEEFTLKKTSIYLGMGGFYFLPDTTVIWDIRFTNGIGLYHLLADFTGLKLEAGYMGHIMGGEESLGNVGYFYLSFGVEMGWGEK